MVSNACRGLSSLDFVPSCILMCVLYTTSTRNSVPLQAMPMNPFRISPTCNSKLVFLIELVIFNREQSSHVARLAFSLGVVLAVMLVATGCGTEDDLPQTSGSIPTPVPMARPVPTVTPTTRPTPSPTPIATSVPNERQVPMPILPARPTSLPTPVPTETPSATPAASPMPTPSEAAPPTATPIPTPTSPTTQLIPLDPRLKIAMPPPTHQVRLPYMTFQSSSGPLHNLYDYLVGVNRKTGAVENTHLAEAWSVSDDARKWTFHLKENIPYYMKGKSSEYVVSPEDVRWTWLLQAGIESDRANNTGTWRPWVEEC